MAKYKLKKKVKNNLIKLFIIVILLIVGIILIKDYKYWGYCDCDLILGNMSHFLQPLFVVEYL